MGLYATAIYIQPCQFHDRMKFFGFETLVYKPKSGPTNFLIALGREINQSYTVLIFGNNDPDR